MSEKTTETRAQNPFLKLADAQLAQASAMFEEAARLQAANLEQAKVALDETARLSRETLGYWANLGAESRRMTLDAYKRSMGLFAAVQI